MTFNNDRTWPLRVIVDSIESPVTSSTNVDQLPSDNCAIIQVRGDYTIGQVMVITTNKIGLYFYHFI